jgi:hypothetical protein
LIKLFRKIVCDENYEEKVHCTKKSEIAYEGGKKNFGRDK